MDDSTRDRQVKLIDGGRGRASPVLLSRSLFPSCSCPLSLSSFFPCLSTRQMIHSSFPLLFSSLFHFLGLPSLTFILTSLFHGL